ncbi:MAG TPA: RDD family protein [Myxococcaceae bacterium]|nr:RDD family protein [Myxococcaceae bacterium]
MTAVSSIRGLQTPEGVPIQLELASVGDRLVAAMVDLCLMNALGLVLAILALFTGGRGRAELAAAVMLISFFLIRCFYFPIFELRWRGQTPGKRATKIRIISRSGGALTARAVVARNLLRELELFQPLGILLAPASVAGGFPPWLGLVAGLWVVVFAVLPLVNRDHLRAGDLVAGTLVVRAPPMLLLDDLGATRGRPGLQFRVEQLDIYGAYELQTLEAVLRLGNTLDNASALGAVAEQIQERIGWTPGTERVGPYDFLSAFYAAQRARLEQRLLLGERRERKRPKTG